MSYEYLYTHVHCINIFIFIYTLCPKRLWINNRNCIKIVLSIRNIHNASHRNTPYRRCDLKTIMFWITFLTTLLFIHHDAQKLLLINVLYFEYT